MDIALLAHRIFGSCRPLAWLFVPAAKAADRLRHFGLHDRVEQNIRLFCTPEQLRDSAFLRRLRRDIWYSVIVYNCAPVEYFLFGFPQLNHRGRQSFFPTWEARALYRRITAANPERKVFEGKYNTYLKYRAFYKRDMLLVDEQTPDEAFFDFVRRHPRFVVKPYFEEGGKGVHFEDVAGTTPEALLAKLRRSTVVVEQPIVQSEQMARFHPLSVNTLRLATAVKKDGTAHLLFAFLKLGQGESIVDNGAAGGICCPIDPDTGMVVGPGMTETGKRFLVHPDSGLQINGLRVPQWEQALATALELARLSPTQTYVGWDLALTDDGWVLVEGNRGGTFLITQMLTHQGLRDVLRQYYEV